MKTSRIKINNKICNYRPLAYLKISMNVMNVQFLKTSAI